MKPRMVGLLVGILAGALFVRPPESPVYAHRACCLKVIVLGWSGSSANNRDEFYNYDFTTSTFSSQMSSKVDWPIDLLFTNNATTNVVKQAYWPYSGGAMYARMTDTGAAGWGFDSDTGTKDSRCGTRVHHMRVYANGDQDRMYNWNWGYWVMASAHIDNVTTQPVQTAAGRWADLGRPM